jgi:hypothetical protein
MESLIYVLQDNLSLVLIVIFVRLLCSLSHKDFFVQDGDAKCHLAILKTYTHKNIEYPTGFHRISSIIGIKLNEFIPGLFNLIIWCAFVIGINFFYPINLYSSIYLILSCVLIDEYNKHQYGYSERFCAQLCCSIAFCFIIFDWNIFFSIPFYTYIIFSSKFGRQFVLFICMPCFLLTNKINELFYIVILYAIISLLFPAVRKGIIHQIKWTYNYMPNKLSTISFSGKLRMFYEFHFIRILLFPELFLLYFFDFHVFMVLLIVFVVISLRMFSMVGESWRYIEWAMFVPTIILVTDQFIYLLVLKLLGFLVYNSLVNIRLRSKIYDYKKDALEITNFLEGKGEVLPIPYRTGDELVSVNPGVNLLAWWPVDGSKGLEKLPSKMITYGGDLLEKSKWLVANKRLLSDEDYDHFSALKNEEIVISNSTYILVKNIK